MNQLFKKIKQENLSQNEKEEIFFKLQSFVAENPVHNELSPFYNPWIAFKQKTFVIPMVLIFILTITTGTTFAANKSLPGDILYPIKIFSENIQSIATVGTKARVTLLANNTITRLKEVEKLANSGRLNSKTREEVENKFDTQAVETLKNIDELESEGNVADASTLNLDFKTSLEEHEKRIIQLSNHKDTQEKTKKELGTLITNIRLQISKTSNSNDNLENHQATSTDESNNRENSNQKNKSTDKASSSTSNIREKGEIDDDLKNTRETNTELREYD